MMNFDLTGMTVLYWGMFLEEEQRDADIPIHNIGAFQKTNKQGNEDITYIFESPPPSPEFLGFLLYHQ